MTGTQVQVQGADRLSRTLQAAARNVEQMAATNRAVAERIRAAARPPVRTGRLAGSLRATGSDTEATVSSDVPYAAIIEYGSVRRNIRARRFLRTAADQTSTTAVRMHLDHVNDCLSNVKGI